MKEQAVQQLLNQLRKFGPIPDSEASKIDAATELMHFSKKSMVLMNGEISKVEYFIVEGCLRMFVLDPEGQEHSLSFNIENWWCGDLKSFLNQVPASYSIQAMEDTTTLALKRDSWENLLENSPSVNNAFRVAFHYALIAMHDRIIDSISLSSEQRYLKFLEKYPQIHQRIPQKYIASYIGVTPEFLSALRKKLVNS